MFKFMLKLRQMHQPSWIESVAIALFAFVTLPVPIKVLSRIVLPRTGIRNHLV